METRDELLFARDRLEKGIEKAPGGNLIVKRSNNCVQFYRSDKKNRRYIHRDEAALVKALAQKKYDARYKEAVEAELEQVEKSIEGLKEAMFRPEDILNSIPEEMRVLVRTGFAADSEAEERWKKERNDGKNPIESAVTYLTARGELVKSKSEVMIADRLNYYGVPYDYERSLDDGMMGNYNYYPDFTCLNRRTGKTWYWEHCGRMDDPKYAEKMMLKIMNYSGLDIFLGSELLISMETTKIPLQMYYVERLIRKYLL